MSRSLLVGVEEADVGAVGDGQDVAGVLLQFESSGSGIKFHLKGQSEKK